MSRNTLKNISKLIDIANNEVPIEKQFLIDLQNSIEKSVEDNSGKPSQTYKPSGMNCERAMVYQVLGIEPMKGKASYQLEGICESGTDRHIRMQKNIENMKNILNIDCEYIDIESFIKQRNIQNIDIIGKSGMETKLYNRLYNMSFMCDGIIKYKSKYFIFEFKTETSNKFYKRNSVDEKHYNQAIAYSLNFGLDKVLFIYENRDTCDLKPFILEITDDMRNSLLNKLNYCQSYVEAEKIPPKPQNIAKNACTYCIYKKQCEENNY